MQITIEVPDEYANDLGAFYNSKLPAKEAITELFNSIVKNDCREIIKKDPEVIALKEALEGKIAEKEAAIANAQIKG